MIPFFSLIRRFASSAADTRVARSVMASITYTCCLLLVLLSMSAKNARAIAVGLVIRQDWTGGKGGKEVATMKWKQTTAGRVPSMKLLGS